MEKKTNRLFRLHAIFQRAYNHTENNKNCLDTWSDMLSIPNGDVKIRRYETIAVLKKLHDEIQIARQTMVATKYSKTLFDSAFNQIERVIGFDLLISGWSSYRNTLEAKSINDLQWCAESLEKDEDIIDEKELQGLSKEIDDLKKYVTETNLPPEVKEFVFRQISIIEKAIAEYQIVGIKAFGEAQESAFTEFVRSQEIIKQNPKSEAYTRLGKVWDKVKKYSNNFSKIIRFLKDVRDGTEMGNAMIQFGIETTKQLMQ